jgi:CheY-like chemotaxis protein
VDTDRILRRLIGEHIELVTVPSVQLATVLADAGQIQQVLLNLAVNARDAMPQGGTLTITTANVSLTEESRQMHEMKPGDYVLLTVSDNGSGIAPEIQPHIFEPFFTTKETGKGIGLGLASCHGIIKQNEGHIFLESEPGRGTTFRIYMPCVRDSVSPMPARSAILSRGKGTLLVVEDNTLVRRFVQETLAQNGYTVLEAASGQEALRLARTFADRLHLLITDVVMPRMSGVELAKRLQKIRPEVQVLFMSGHAEDNSIPNREMFDGAVFVQKPFSSSDLIRAVGSALAAEPARTAEPKKH